MVVQHVVIVLIKTNAAAKSVAMVQNKPNLKVTVVGGRATLEWTKGKMSGVNIYVNKGDGRGFVLLYGSTKSKYRDMSPLPTVLTTWIYQIIYRQGDDEVGEYSDPVSAVVMDRLVDDSLVTTKP